MASTQKLKTKRGRDLPENLRRFRYFVEIRDLSDGSVRSLQLRTVIKLRIPKKKEPLGPREEILQIEDGAARIEGKSLDELITQLRAKYPDGLFERTLRRERDFEAERAMDDLMRLIARAAVEKHWRETAGTTETLPK
jgi:hypothetical protein